MVYIKPLGHSIIVSELRIVYLDTLKFEYKSEILLIIFFLFTWEGWRTVTTVILFKIYDWFYTVDEGNDGYIIKYKQMFI